MKIIESLSDKICDEIEDAGDYAEMALEVRDQYPELAATLNLISLDETKHMNLLHNAVASIIQQYKAEHGEPPADMLAVYNYEHKKQIEKAADVKSLQMMYQEKISP